MGKSVGGDESEAFKRLSGEPNSEEDGLRIGKRAVKAVLCWRLIVIGKARLNAKSCEVFCGCAAGAKDAFKASLRRSKSQMKKKG
jgi:hypothetical protein